MAGSAQNGHTLHKSDLSRHFKRKDKQSHQPAPKSPSETIFANPTNPKETMFKQRPKFQPETRQPWVKHNIKEIPKWTPNSSTWLPPTPTNQIGALHQTHGHGCRKLCVGVLHVGRDHVNISLSGC